MLHKLKKIVKEKKRAGRGVASGLGKSAGRGTKGQRSRAGRGISPRFEGGQTPLFARLPKIKGPSRKRRCVKKLKKTLKKNNATT